jgi:hypothetical protein
MKIDLKKIQEHRYQLENHSLLVTNMIQSREDLKLFMEYHVFAVWDFMSLLKTMQHNIVPSGNIWLPTAGTRSNIARTINEIVLCEESDISPDGNSSISHFDLYLQAMLEIGADTKPITNYLDSVGKFNAHVECSHSSPIVMDFVNSTFKAIDRGVHCAAASFCYGRETVIPSMFKRILRQINISNTDAPKFHYYLERHIQVDGDDHGPMSENLVNYFCKDDPFLVYEAEQSAIDAIKARIRLFDGIESILLSN